MQKTIAEKYGISQAMVSRIFRGDAWERIQWPDGTSGGISHAKRREVLQAHRKLRAEQGQPDPITADVAAEVERRMLANEAAREEEFRDKMMVSGRRKPSKPTRQPKHKVLRWSELQAQAQDHPLLEEANDSPSLRAAMCKVLGTIPSDEWSSDDTIAIIRSVEKQSHSD